MSRDDYVRLMAGLGLEKEASSEAYDVITHDKVKESERQRVGRERHQSNFWGQFLISESIKLKIKNLILITSSCPYYLKLDLFGFPF